MSNRALSATVVLLVAALPFLSACSNSTSAAKAPDRPNIEVAPVLQEDVAIYHEWIGTLDGMVDAVIKAQVTGYLLEQDYKEGSFVRKGQLLFEIDPRPFKAALDQARAQVAQAAGQLAQAKAQLTQAEAQHAVAVANQGKTQLDVDRYKPLAQQQAVSQQDLDNAIQSNLAAKAQVQAAQAFIETARAQIQAANAAVDQAKAVLETATLNLGYTRISSPIDGIAGEVQQQVGDLVGPSSSPVTTVSTVDPIKVYFTISEQEYLDLVQKSKDQGGLEGDMRHARLELILADGSTYPHPGTFYFTDREINANTGAIRMAGLFPNPGNILRPGQYGRVRSAFRIKKGALLVPQRAVTELQGNYQVAVVDRNGTASIRNVHVGDRIGDKWIVEAGLKPGERVAAEGAQKVHDGQQVTPKPYTNAVDTPRK